MKYLKSFNESIDFDPIGTKVKFKGGSKMEYGLIVQTPKHLTWCDDPVVILWDTHKEDDYEQALLPYDIVDDYQFKYIDSDGNPINRGLIRPRRGRNK